MPAAFLEIKAELESSGLATRFLEQAAGPGAVDSNTGGPTLTDLDARGRKFDQSLKQFRGWSPAAMSVPKQFPALVGLPVVSRVEQSHAPQVRCRCLPLVRHDPADGPMLTPPRMPPRSASRVRPRTTWHVSVGR
jgi:hypothetical protein